MVLQAVSYRCTLRSAAAVGQRLATPPLLPAVAGPVGAVATRHLWPIGLLAALQTKAEQDNTRVCRHKGSALARILKTQRSCTIYLPAGVQQS